MTRGTLLLTLPLPLLPSPCPSVLSDGAERDERDGGGRAVLDADFEESLIVSFRAGQYDKAVGPLSLHLRTQPADALARRMLGVSHYLLGDFKQAVETLKPLEPSITDDAELAYAYGVSLARLADSKPAGAIFARLAERHADAPQARLYAAQGFMMIADYDGALREYRAAARLDPSAAKAHFQLSHLYSRLGETALAARHLERFQKLKSQRERAPAP